ncbi:MAG TPA: sortase, partial [Verrucomicrobiae bacterium]|nr:sortase [Verrucomicrobiae bacterium]
MNTYDPHGTDDLTLPPDDKKGGQGAARDATNPVIGPTPPPESKAGDQGANLASNVIRQKLDQIYAEEPTATHELAEAAAKARAGRSKHQQFMYNLGTSGKDLATIQTEWHHYYEGLTDKEKHDVWREFYASQAAVADHTKKGDKSQVLAKHKHQAAKRPGGRSRSPRSSKDIQQSIRNTVSSGGKLEARHNLQSILFGLGLGAIVLIIFLFGFFNEVVLAPFIQPSRASAATPLIVGSDNVAPSSTPEVIIPKINVQIPVNYNETSTNEATIENDLENGVVHYPNTAVPGQDGNAAFFGHSSNNIFNKGKYKFAFVLLHTLVEGDTFYLT